MVITSIRSKKKVDVAGGGDHPEKSRDLIPDIRMSEPLQ